MNTATERRRIFFLPRVLPKGNKRRKHRRMTGNNGGKDMEPILDINHHLVCYADYSRGLIEHKHQKEMVRISVPVGGEVLFITSECFTLVHRTSPTYFTVISRHHHGLGIA